MFRTTAETPAHSIAPEERLSLEELWEIAAPWEEATTVPTPDLISIDLSNSYQLRILPSGIILVLDQGMFSKLAMPLSYFEDRHRKE